MSLCFCYFWHAKHSYSDKSLLQIVRDHYRDKFKKKGGKSKGAPKVDMDTAIKEDSGLILSRQSDVKDVLNELSSQAQQSEVSPILFD